MRFWVLTAVIMKIYVLDHKDSVVTTVVLLYNNKMPHVSTHNGYHQA